MQVLLCAIDPPYLHYILIFLTYIMSEEMYALFLGGDDRGHKITSCSVVSWTTDADDFAPVKVKVAAYTQE